MKRNIAVFASGSGTNAENIIRCFREDNRLNVSLLISNKADAFALQRAHRLDVPCVVLEKEEWKQGKSVLALLQDHRIDFIVLAGFLLRIPEAILHAYPDKIINIHPSLLPKYGGKGMYGDRVHQAVVEARDKESGITIHYINEHYDQGQVIFQTTCPVHPEDSPEDVACKVHALEYQHYPEVIRRIILSE